MRRLLPRACFVLLALGLPGCGQPRAEPLDLATPQAPRGVTDVRLAGDALQLTVPQEWQVAEREEPLAATVTSGTATLAVWRYRRAEPLPSGEEALEEARRRLLREVRRRDGGFRADASRTFEIDGHPAVELVGRQRVGEAPRRVRSTHVYADGHEIVLDAMAPPEHFPRVDREVFRPVRSSLRVLGAD